MPYKNEWLSFGGALIDSTNAGHVCEGKAEEFNIIKNNINDVSVNSARVNLAKQIISTKKCFSTTQVKQIVELFSVESSRLKLHYMHAISVPIGKIITRLEVLFLLQAVRTT